MTTTDGDAGARPAAAVAGTTGRPADGVEPAAAPRPVTPSSTPPAGPPPRLAPPARDAESLDEVVRVTSRHGWLALAAIAVAVVAALGWAFTARMPQQITVTGVIRSGSDLAVVSPVDGRVTTLAVAPGDAVAEGQTLAVLTPFAGAPGSAATGAPGSGPAVAAGDVVLVAEEPGVVRELYVGAGDGVTPGAPVGLVRPTGSAADGARVVAYVTPLDARDFRPDNPIRVVVPDVSRGTEQTLSAGVDRVAELPTSRAGMAAEVEDADLAEVLFVETGGSPYRVDLRLHDTATAEPGTEIFDGQVVQIVVTYDDQHPIELLFGS